MFAVPLCCDFIIPHQYWQLCDENKNFFGIFNFIMCSNKQCIWKFSKCHKSVGAFIGRPPWWYCLLIHITFDVMKIVCSLLHALRAIVCVAHERENTVLPYIITTTLLHLWIFKQSQSLCRYLRASNERPYRIAQTKNYTMLGHNMFLILQTIYTNGVRRLAVRYFTNKIEN